MTEPTITDEELVKWEVAWRALAEPPPVMRLIGALRAERQAAEVNAAMAVDLAQRLATVRALHPRWPDGLCPRCRVDWPCETAQAVGE